MDMIKLPFSSLYLHFTRVTTCRTLMSHMHWVSISNEVIIIIIIIIIIMSLYSSSTVTEVVTTYVWLYIHDNSISSISLRSRKLKLIKKTPIIKGSLKAFCFNSR